MTAFTRNRDLYQTDPAARTLVNKGVATVNDNADEKSLAVLRYELETFVCEGEYKAGMIQIITSFLDTLNHQHQPDQPGVWVSGFYGSGKSHMVKMLRALWVNTPFGDHATARGIARLPVEVRDALRELDAAGLRHGGLHAASGTLGAGAEGSVRLALLGIVFKSAGLPEKYPVARFVHWLRSEQLLEPVRAHVTAQGGDWNDELRNFHVARGLRTALAALRPDLYETAAACDLALNNQFPRVDDVSADDMLQAIRDALTHEGRFPLTLVVLDEVQQFIGTDARRSIDVQEMVEAVSKHLGGKLIFVGTGQSAVSDTPHLKRLMGRFTVPVQLSEADVDTVVREVILAKRPDALAPLGDLLERNLGEVSRHLQGSSIGHQQSDVAALPGDYPILPVRRRFWERTARMLDTTGVDSQLRNQLSLIDGAVRQNADLPLGHVVPADYAYFESAGRLLHGRKLPRVLHDATMRWRSGSDDEQLLARACGIIFLINTLAVRQDLGIRATVDAVADLLVEDLTKGSTALRARLPLLLDGCELLMKIGDEYRIQTEESTAWNDAYNAERHRLNNEIHRIDTDRSDRLRGRVGDLLRAIVVPQGSTRVQRRLRLVFDQQLPPDAAGTLCAWVRDEWSCDEQSVRAEARQAGLTDPVIHIFIPRRSADDLRQHIITSRAAQAVLDQRGTPQTAEGADARAAMESLRSTAELRIGELLDDAIRGARVYQGGGAEVAGTALAEMVTDAARSALTRLYPHFDTGDHVGWAKVLERVQRGAPDALTAVEHAGDPAEHPVCRALLGAIGAGRSGGQLRDQFENAPYGWSGDTVDAALYVLVAAGVVRATSDHHQAVEATALERKAIGRTMFTREHVVASAKQLMAVRKLGAHVLGRSIAPKQESAMLPDLLDALDVCVAAAGGAPPLPAPPVLPLLADLRAQTGTAQLVAVADAAPQLTETVDTCRAQAETIARRIPVWQQLEALHAHARELAEAAPIHAQIEAIRTRRLLVTDPDPVPLLVATLTTALRTRITDLDSRLREAADEGERLLAADSRWLQLEPEQRAALRLAHALPGSEPAGDSSAGDSSAGDSHANPAQTSAAAATPAPTTLVPGTTNVPPATDLADAAAVLRSLTAASLALREDRLAAMPARYAAALAAAARLLEPAARRVALPPATLGSTDDLDAWLDEVRTQLQDELARGPIII